MSFLGRTTWTPVDSGDGDLGTTRRSVDLSRDDTSYHGHGGELSKKDSASQLSRYSDGYEMKEMAQSRE